MILNSSIALVLKGTLDIIQLSYFVFFLFRCAELQVLIQGESTNAHEWQSTSHIILPEKKKEKFVNIYLMEVYSNIYLY